MFNIGRQGQANIISESGLYTLVLRCRDAVKKGTLPHRFRKWVTHEVLPQIRKTGQYLPEKYQPESTEVFSKNDRTNLAHLVWAMSKEFRFKTSWSNGIWFALRQVTGIPSPKPFETQHIPLIAEECIRIFNLRTTSKTSWRRQKNSSFGVSFANREEADRVISEIQVALNSALHQTENRLESTLAKWQQLELKQFIDRGYTP